MLKRIWKIACVRVLAAVVVSLLAATLASAAAAPTFNGFIRLPVDLYANAGAHLEAGKYTVLVRQTANGGYVLVFRQTDKAIGSVKGVILTGPIDNDSLDAPLIGTQYLHSSADPVGSEAERHFSKSGLPHYQEENRDWKATLRAYNARDGKETLWFFEQRQPDGTWSHVEFVLHLNPQ